MSDFHLAQINTARLRAPLEDPSMVEFVEGLTLMNELADRSPGFVWRLEGESGDGTIAAPTDPSRIYTLSVWESPEHLRAYAYQSQHLEYLRRRRDWFHPHGHQAALVLWWIPAGQVPTLRQGISRLGRLQAAGPTPEAFTLRELFPAPELTRR
ncbi:DUF3291 domain-containing protein [Actinoplanes sp. KI2]|uniref:DUF3291 domain-containing protein n=1 Tax=Actinoplanes sp. KI2 TaxID=2983315 RepID=UPI0021D5C4F5|nr:DUF3291 domain-containing protein [Actinoplanes sp. KI2]MCU7728162.1 DUF3291 domain-containing protein [Actinoplanes sp. KI2]